MNENLHRRSWTPAFETQPGPRAIARFVWTDSETADELTVEVHGCETFFEQLALLGFERLETVRVEGRDEERTTSFGTPDVSGHARMDATPTPTQKKQPERRPA